MAPERRASPLAHRFTAREQVIIEQVALHEPSPNAAMEFSLTPSPPTLSRREREPRITRNS